MKEKLIALKKETAELDEARKSYKIQSEWHRLMYMHLLEIETLKRVLTLAKNIK